MSDTPPDWCVAAAREILSFPKTGEKHWPHILADLIWRRFLQSEEDEERTSQIPEADTRDQ